MQLHELKFTTLEARTEEELIGNLLLVHLHHCTLNQADALKALWLEVEEYSDQISENTKNDHFYAAKKHFYFKEIQVEAFFIKLHTISSKFDKCSNKTKKDVKLIEDFLLSSKNKISLISILHDEFDDYDVFISLENEYVFFSWIDVI